MSEPTTLLDYARETVGLPCKGFFHGVHITWTTDVAKADAMRAVGARVQTATALSGRVIGYDISFPPDATVPLSGAEEKIGA